MMLILSLILIISGNVSNFRVWPTMRLIKRVSLIGMYCMIVKPWYLIAIAVNFDLTQVRLTLGYSHHLSLFILIIRITAISSSMALLLFGRTIKVSILILMHLFALLLLWRVETTPPARELLHPLLLVLVIVLLVDISISSLLPIVLWAKHKNTAW